MKKALALVLALVLALSLGVVAFADTLDVVTLVKAPEAGTDLIPLNKIDLDANKVVIAGEGGTYHFVLDPSKEYENVVVTGNGVVAAKVLDYDPEVYEDIDNIHYYVYNVATQHRCDWVTDYDFYTFGLSAEEIAAGTDSYKFCKAAAEALNKAEHKTNWVVKTDDNVNVVEITIADNYSAAYKEGTLKIEAKEVSRDAEGKVTKKVAVSASVKLVRDVVIFGYEEVKWAAKYGEALLIGSNGYSDYKSAVKGYKTPTLDDPEIVEDGAVVVSTTEFRAIEGQDLKVAADRDRDNYVTIKSFEESYIADYGNGSRNRGSAFFCSDFYGAFFVCYRIVVLNSDLNKGEVGIGFRNISGSSTSFIEDIANCGNVCIRSNTIGNSAIFSNIRPACCTVGIGSFACFCCSNNSRTNYVDIYFFACNAIPYIVRNGIYRSINGRIIFYNFCRDSSGSRNGYIFIVFVIKLYIVGPACASEKNNFIVFIKGRKSSYRFECSTGYRCRAKGNKSKSKSRNAEAQCKNKSKNKSKCFFHVSFPPKIFFLSTEEKGGADAEARRWTERNKTA